MEMRSAEQINSSGIAAEMRDQGLEQLEFLGRFLPNEIHPNVCEADAAIYIYRFPNGYMVADTNGDPIWQAQDGQAWQDMMEEFSTGL